jgi:L-arabinose isomerase
MLEMYAEMLDIELVVIDRDTTKRAFKKELRWNEASFRLGSDGRF